MKTLTIRSADGRAIGVYRIVDALGNPVAAFREETRVMSGRAAARSLNGELLCMARLCRLQRLAADGRWHECSLPEHIVTTQVVMGSGCSSCGSSNCGDKAPVWLGSDVADHDKSISYLKETHSA